MEHNGNRETAMLHYDLRRSGDRMTLEIAADRPLGLVSIRLGPFAKQPAAADVLVNGKHPSDAKPSEFKIAQSGDSWWISFTTSIGPAAASAAE